MVNLFRGIKIKAGIIKDKKIPIPPNNAVGFVCHLSSLGIAIKPYRCENLIMSGIIKIERKNDVKKAIKYFIMKHPVNLPQKTHLFS